MNRPLQVFIGYDENEPIAYHVLAHSIMRRASRPVSITPLYLPQLVDMAIWRRARGPTESTQFSMTRFLTPWLSGFDRVSIFMDCDMLCLADICELEDIALASPDKDVLVVPHDYTPTTTTKFLGQPQTVYPCKNWSSLMVFNGHRVRTCDLTPDYVNNADAAALHRFEWARDIGCLDPTWNYLVGEYPIGKMPPSMLHYTLGGPWFNDCAMGPYAELWRQELADLTHVAQRVTLLAS